MRELTETSEERGSDRVRRIEEHARRISKEQPRQSVEEVRTAVAEFLRRLDVNEVGELDDVTGSERRLLSDLLSLYDSCRNQMSQAPPPIRRRLLSRPIDAVEVEVLLDRYRIEDGDLEDDTVIPENAIFGRRNLQLGVRRRQAVRPATVSNLCAAMTAVLQARGVDAVVTETDILPVTISISRLRQVIADSSYLDEVAVIQAVNERIPGELEVVKRRGTIEVERPQLSADLLKEGESITLMHFQLRALTSVLNVPEESVFAHVSAPQPESAIRWICAVGLDALIDRIFAARQRRDGGFRVDASLPGENNPTQPYTTAQCTVGLLRTSHAEKWAKELQGSLMFLAESRRDYHVGQSVVRGWRYFVFDGTEPDYPIADIACWVIVAEAAALRKKLWPGEQQAQAVARLTENIDCLLKQQTTSGGFVPIPQVEDKFSRSYTTCMAIWALAEAVWAGSDGKFVHDAWLAALTRGVGWLLDHHRPGVGFIPDPSIQRSWFFPGLHAQCLFALSLVERLRVSNILPQPVEPITDSDEFLAAMRLLTDWFAAARRQVEDHNVTIDRHSHFLPTNYRLENTRHLWAPWAMAAFHNMDALGVEGAQSLRDQVAARFQDFWQRGGEEAFGCNGTYELAEALYCFAHVMGEEM